jgi:hypothetical protein
MAEDCRVAPPGYTAHSMTVRDALTSPDAAVREAVAVRLKQGAMQALDLALQTYIKAAMDEQFSFYRAQMN